MMRLKPRSNLSQHLLNCIFDGFIAMNLLRRVDQRKIERKPLRLQKLDNLTSIESIRLTHTTLQKIALVGTLVKLLGHREQHLYTTCIACLIGLSESHIAKRIYKATTTLVEYSTNGLQRAQTLVAR